MILKTLIYSTKVWLTSIIVAPLPSTIYILRSQYPLESGRMELLNDGLYMYFLLILGQLLYSALTWILFTIVTYLILSIPAKEILQTSIVFIIGLLLTVGSFMATVLPLDSFNDRSKSQLVFLMICDCSCIGWGIWFYRPKLKGQRSASEN
jgi:hypothetical protein